MCCTNAIIHETRNQDEGGGGGRNRNKRRGCVKKSYATRGEREKKYKKKNNGFTFKIESQE